jgi:hypothetical protein
LLAGSAVGPGGFSFVSELVQVIFHLGRWIWFWSLLFEKYTYISLSILSTQLCCHNHRWLLSSCFWWSLWSKLWAWDEWQVETVAQFGVVFLLFALGLEFSMSKVRTFHLSLQPQFTSQNFQVLLCAFSVIIVY